jgi:hypothetical protein
MKNQRQEDSGRDSFYLMRIKKKACRCSLAAAATIITDSNIVEGAVYDG